MLCEKLHRFIGRKYERWGHIVYNHTKVVVVLSLTACLILCAGFLKFNKFGQSERIFYPQNSQIFRDLDRSEPSFDYYVQQEEFLIASLDGQSVLTKAVFTRALHLHKQLIKIVGFDNFCVKTRTGSCLVVSPLELFNYTESNFDYINAVLLKAVNNMSYIMDNGYTARTNLPLIFGNFIITQTNISSNIIRVIYPVKFPKSRGKYEQNREWEAKMLELMRTAKPQFKHEGYDLIFNAVRSVHDSIEKNTEDNFLLINASIASMVLFCAIAMTRLGSKVHGHFLLSLFGILCIILGTGAGFGFVLFIGQPYVGFVGVLPFLVLGIGIDDMFIIINSIDHIDSKFKGAERLGHAMKVVGFSVTMTTLTDLVAFLIGSVSRFPAIQIFCIYAFFSISFAFLMIMTLFMALLSYDIKRVESGRHDCLPCISTNKSKETTDSQELLNTEKNLTYTEKAMTGFGQMLMLPLTKVFVVLFGLAIIGIGAYGTSKTDINFDYKIVGSDSTEHVHWINTIEKYFPIFKQFRIDIVLDEKGIDYSSKEVQKQFFLLNDIIEGDAHFSNDTVNWMTSFLNWNSTLSNNSNNFCEQLNLFLSIYKEFKQDIVFSSPCQISASRIHVMTRESLSWSFRKDAMISLREALKTRTNRDFFAVVFAYIYASHLDVIIKDTLTNVAICCSVILVVTLPYVIKPVVSFLLLFSFLCFIIELLGVMFFWGLSLNLITMIVMVMAVGFTVDYSCHVTHAYLISSEETPERRVVDAMRSMGLSVLKGGLSTLTGIIVLSLSDSKLFILFFKMMFSIVLLGLYHGMIVLPVLLTVFCRTKSIHTVLQHEASRKLDHNRENGKLLKEDSNKIENGRTETSIITSL